MERESANPSRHPSALVGVIALTHWRAQAAALLVAACLVSFAAKTHAQTPEDIERANQQTEQIQRQERIRQEREREEAMKRRPPTHIQVPEPKQPEPKKDAVCRDIREVVITGSKLLNEDERNELSAPYRNRCLGVNDIERLMADITRRYFQLGYVGARVYVPQQDLSQGRLELLVVEGTVEGFRIQDGERNSVSVTNAFPGVVGAPLNLRDIEQGLDQINRLRSNNATMSIQPGKEPGASVVEVRNEPRKVWNVTLSGDNFGSKSTGRTQASSTLGVDNPLGFNDFVSATWRRSVPGHHDSEISNSKSLLYSVPFGYATLTLSGSRSEYVSSIVTASNDVLIAKGDSATETAALDWVVYRDQRHHLSFSTAITRKESVNYLAEQLLQVSSRTLAVHDMDLKLRVLGVAGGVATVQVGMAQGLKTFAALEDAEALPDAAPRAQFQKLKFDVSYFKPLDETGQTTWNTQLSGQRAASPLYGSEQISIGGPFSVRGFLDSSLASDNGMYVRNDLRTSYPAAWLSSGATLSPYIGWDWGRVTPRAEGGQKGILSGAGIGATLRNAGWSVDVMYMQPLIKPNDFGNENGAVLARVSADF